MANTYSQKLPEAERIKRRNVSVATATKIAKGEIKKQPCYFCERKDYVVAHHQDYDKPMEVVWLCGSCHKKLHILLNLADHTYGKRYSIKGRQKLSTN